jgi:hypothetical protein
MREILAVRTMLEMRGILAVRTMREILAMREMREILAVRTTLVAAGRKAWRGSAELTLGGLGNAAAN